MHQPYDFSDTLGDLDAGIFLNKVSAALRDTAIGVVENNRKGKVVLELSLEQQGDSNQVLMTHKLKYDKPTRRGKVIEEDATSTPLWVGGKGLSMLPDASQQDLFTHSKTEECA